MNFDELTRLVSDGKSTYQIAEECKTSQTNVRHWLKKFGLTTVKGPKPHKCMTCGETDPDEFYGRSKETCKICHNDKMMIRFWEIRAKIDEIKTVPCMDCGKNFPPCAMDFDHREGKIFNISRAASIKLNWETIQEEINKCDIVCSNCHRIRTHGCNNIHQPSSSKGQGPNLLNL